MKPRESVFRYSGSEAEMTDHAAALIMAEAWRAVADHGYFSLVLAGGNSPRPLYQKLARGVSTALLRQYNLPLPEGCSSSKSGLLELPESTWLFQGDERALPPSHPETNYRMIQETLLRHSSIAPVHLFRMAAEAADSREAAKAYEATIRTFFLKREPQALQDFPAFDLVLLGMGDDGHTASLFMENPDALQEKSRWVIAVEAQNARPPGRRLTLTLPLINHARNILFFTTGKKKAELAEQIFRKTEKNLPASLVKPLNGKLFWFSAQP